MLLTDLLSAVYEFLEDRITLDELEDWVATRFPELFRIPQSPAAKLAATIELGLAEMSDSLIDEDDFRSELRNAVQQYTTIRLDYPRPETSTVTESSNATMPSVRLAYPGEITVPYVWSQS